MPIKTEYKYIRFERIPFTGKTSRWKCKSVKMDFMLGAVRYYSSWRAYVFEPSFPTIFNAGCLEDIQHFLAQLTANLKDRRFKKFQTAETALMMSVMPLGTPCPAARYATLPTGADDVCKATRKGLR